MNNCRFVVRNDYSSGSIAKHSDVEELKLKLETLVLLEEMVILYFIWLAEISHAYWLVCAAKKAYCICPQ